MLPCRTMTDGRHFMHDSRPIRPGLGPEHKPRVRGERRLAACVLVTCACVIATIEAGCGQTPVRLGVLVNEAGLIKAELGRSSVDVVSEGLHLLHRDVVTGAYSEYRRVKEADVVGD